MWQTPFKMIMNGNIRMGVISLVTLASVWSGNASESYWNQFRGPNGQGWLDGAKPPATLGASTLKWKVALAPGHSSPVVWKDRVFLSGVENNRLVTLCVNRTTGAVLWKQAAPEVTLEQVHPDNDNASPTPVLDPNHVYSYFGSYGVTCYDHDGHEVWHRKLPTRKRTYGTSSSPIIHKELLILVLDDMEKTSEILALNKKDGTTSWEVQRPLIGSGWSTPTIWNSGQREELVVLGRENLTSYDVNNGEELWWITGLSRQTIPVPIIGKDRLYISSADRGGEGGNPPDPDAMWRGLAHFDANKDGKLVVEEMSDGFGWPLRPDLPVDSPGWGFPIRDEKGKLGFIKRFDKDNDSAVSEQEYKDSFRGPQKANGGRQTLMSIRPGAKGDAKDTHVEWVVRRNIAEIPSVVLYNNRIFSVRDGGILTCFNAENGEVFFSERIDAPGQYSASAIAADGRVYLASVNGMVTVVKAHDKLQVLSRHDFKEKIYATPALQDGTIYIRTQRNLYAFAE